MTEIYIDIITKLFQSVPESLFVNDLEMRLIWSFYQEDGFLPDFTDAIAHLIKLKCFLESKEIKSNEFKIYEIIREVNVYLKNI